MPLGNWEGEIACVTAEPEDLPMLEHR